mgnify:CR=1 FL=1
MKLRIDTTFRYGPGMKGEARIRVGSRTLIEYAFEPIRQLREEFEVNGTAPLQFEG